MNLPLKPMRLIFVAVLLLCFAGFSVSPVHASMSSQEILKKADEARGRTEGLEWEIYIESIEKGRRQDRTLKVTARGYNSLAEFLAPANMKGQKLLMSDRTMWFAKPGLSKAVPISPRQRLLGKAANGDIAATNYSGDYKIAKAWEEMLDGEACEVFDLAAIDKKATYDKIRYWISKERLVGVRAEFYTVSGKMFKAASFEYENSIMIGGRPREFVSKMIITDAIMKDEVTTLHYRKISARTVPDATFNLNLLMK
jgi:outer membrane lipoprotein-sorting protein